MLRLGFIVEGDSDRIVVEWIARRLLPPEAQVRTIRLGSRAALPTAFTSVLTFFAKDYDQVIVVFDSDSTLTEVVAEQQRDVELSLCERGLLHRVSVCPAVPEIEAWIAAGIPELELPLENPKVSLLQLLRSPAIGANEVARLEGMFDLSLARQRSPSFSHFVEQIEQAGALSTTGGGSSPP